MLAPPRTRTLQAVRAVAAEVADLAAADQGLAGGLSGQVLFLFLLEQACPGEGYRAAAERLLAEAVASLAAEDADPSLLHGLAGVAWVAEVVDQAGAAPWLDTGELRAAADELLLEQLGLDFWLGPYGLGRGLVGLGLYGLARAERPAGRALVAGVVSHLLALAEKHGAFTAWWTPNELLPAEDQAQAPRGAYDLSALSGMLGAVSFLVQAHGRGLGPAGLEGTITAAIRWLDGQRTDALPLSVPLDGPPRPAPVAWGCGDLGLACLLAQAGGVLGRAAWRARATELAGAAAQRASEEPVRGLGLAEGSAGLALTFARLARGGAPILHAAADAWQERTLVCLERGGGGAGLLHGRSGAALALLSALVPARAAWTSLLLL